MEQKHFEMTKTNNGRRKYREKISKENKTITQCPYQFEKLRVAFTYRPTKDNLENTFLLPPWMSESIEETNGSVQFSPMTLPSLAALTGKSLKS